VNGKFENVGVTKYFRVDNPATGDHLFDVPLTPSTEFDRAVKCAKKAFEEWRNVPVSKRCRLMKD